MTSTSFQIRICNNPDCGLRYPLIKGSQFGERCPVCLGKTTPIIEKPLPHETIKEKKTPPTRSTSNVLLDNVRSGMNVGSIFRTADGFGFRHLYLCGITPGPDMDEVRKSAVGSEQYLEWSTHKNAVELIGILKSKEYKIWVLENSQNSIDINSAISIVQKPKHIILVVGNEVTGVDPGILEIADRIIHLPMRGHKRSFNVAIAFGIAAQIIHSWK